MAITISQLLVRVGADTAGAEAGLGRVGGMMRGAIVAAAAGAVLAVAGLGIASVKMAGDFQASMVQLVTGAGESKNNLKMVGDGILQMAQDTATPVSQLAEAMYSVESSSFHGAAGLLVLRDAAEAAKVGNASVAEVAHAVSAALVTYGLTAKDAAAVTNTLVASTSAGNMHMADLSAALGTVMLSAKNAGVNLQELGASLAVMTSEGLNAADAATYLKQMFVGLEAPGSKAQKALTGIGLSASDVAQTMRKQPDGMISALTQINAALDTKFPQSAAVAAAEMTKVKNHQESMTQALANLANNTSPAYIDALKNISGGSKNMQAMLALTGTGLQTLRGNFDSITQAVAAGGNGITNWNMVQGDFNFKIDKAKEVVQTLMIKLGTGLLPIVGQVVDAFSSHVIPIVDGLGKAFSGTGGIIGKDVVPMLSSLTSWVQKQVVPALMGLYTTFQTQIMPAVTKFADYAVKNIIPVLEKLATWVLTKVIPAAQQIEVWFLNHVLPVLEQVWGVIATDVIPAFQNIANAVIGQLVPAIEKLWNKLSPVLLPVLRTVGDVLKNAVGPALSGVITIISTLIDTISTVIGKIGDFMNAVGGLKNAAGNAMGGVGNFLGGVGNFFSGHAAGGDITRNEIAWVGEDGPELVALPGGSHVYPNGTSPANGGSGIRGLPAGMSGNGGGSVATGTINNITNLDGRTIARTLLPYIVDIIRTDAAVRHM